MNQGTISLLRRVPRGVMMVERFLQMQPEDVDEVCCTPFPEGTQAVFEEPQVLVNSLLDVFCKLGDMSRLEAGPGPGPPGASTKAPQERSESARQETLALMKRYGIKGSAVTYGTIVKAVRVRQNCRIAFSLTALRHTDMQATSTE